MKRENGSAAIDKYLNDEIQFHLSISSEYAFDVLIYICDVSGFQAVRDTERSLPPEEWDCAARAPPGFYFYGIVCFFHVAPMPCVVACARQVLCGAAERGSGATNETQSKFGSKAAVSVYKSHLLQLSADQKNSLQLLAMAISAGKA